MPAGYVDLFLDQGTTFNTSLNIDDVNGVPFDLTNFVASAQMRRSYYSANASATFIANTGIDPTLGVISLTLDSANTTNIKPGTYVYDVTLELDNEIVRVLEGRIFVSPGVTR